MLSLTLALSSNQAIAVPTYETTDIVDAIGDPDRMKITYRTSDWFQAGGGFNLFYDVNEFADLSVTTIGGDWFSSVTQPDPIASLDGIVSFMALVDMMGVANTFEVEFTVIGNAIPGSQPFEFFNASFDVVRSGQTMPLVQSVPEPATPLLLAFGGLMLIQRRRSRIKRNTNC